MQTQTEFNTSVINFTNMINDWAEATANPRSYLIKANYLTTGTERVAYNTALSALKTLARAEPELSA